MEISSHTVWLKIAVLPNVLSSVHACNLLPLVCSFSQSWKFQRVGYEANVPELHAHVPSESTNLTSYTGTWYPDTGVAAPPPHKDKGSGTTLTSQVVSDINWNAIIIMYNVHVAYMCTCTYTLCTCKYISYKMPCFTNTLQYNINCYTCMGCIHVHVHAVCSVLVHGCGLHYHIFGLAAALYARVPQDF